MEPDLRFFQAAASVIPTLLVAIVFTVKLFEVRAFPVPPSDTPPPGYTGDAYSSSDWEFHFRGLGAYFDKMDWYFKTLPVLLVVTALIVITVLGERAALEAILNSEPTSGRALIVKLALLSELTMLAVGILRPYLMGLYKLKHYVGYISMAIGVVGALAALFLPV